MFQEHTTTCFLIKGFPWETRDKVPVAGKLPTRSNKVDSATIAKVMIDSYRIL